MIGIIGITVLAVLSWDIKIPIEAGMKLTNYAQKNLTQIFGKLLNGEGFNETYNQTQYMDTKIIQCVLEILLRNMFRRF